MTAASLDGLVGSLMSIALSANLQVGKVGKGLRLCRLMCGKTLLSGSVGK